MTHSAKLRASVFVCLTCSLAYEPTCFACRALRVCLRAYLFGILVYLRARVLTRLGAHALLGLRFYLIIFFIFFLLITKKV